MSRFPRKLMLLAGLLLALPAAAQWVSRDGQALPDESWRRHDKALGAMLQCAHQSEYQRFEREWLTTPAEHAPELRTTDRARRGDIVVVSVAYSGCADSPNNPGSCDATMELRVLKPDGSVYGEHTASLSGGQPPAVGTVQLSPVSMHILFEPDDPLGRYTVEAVINDPAQDAWLTLRDHIELEDAVPEGAAP